MRRRIAVKSIPVGTYPATLLFHSTQEVKGMIPLVTIVAGEPITSNEIAKPSAGLGSQSEYLPIPSGYVAIDHAHQRAAGGGGLHPA